MPEESTTLDLVELTRRAFEAANRRDLDEVTSFFASDAIFAGRVGSDRGRAAIRSMLEEWFGAYKELEFKLEDVRTSATGLCSLGSSRRALLLAAPFTVTFGNTRDGSSSGSDA
jgi:ketosteroid isomerase-like protein